MKVISVDHVDYNDDVYNFHCVPDENYFANSILVHNCYKSNNIDGLNMSLEEFKVILAHINKNHQLTQVAFGADASLKANPAIFDMMKHCRDNGVIPNITVADIDLVTAHKLTEVCGAVSVSLHDDTGTFVKSVNLLKHAMEQTPNGTLRKVNQHVVVSKETLGQVYKSFELWEHSSAYKVDAIVLLALKRRGRGEKFTPASMEDYKQIIDFAISRNIPIGFDSCTAPIFLKITENYPQSKYYSILAEPCESMLFSIYIDVKGNVYPCSFCEDEDKKLGNLLEATSFDRDIWNSPKTIAWRSRLINSSSSCTTCKFSKSLCRSCPIYDVTPCKKHDLLYS